MNNNNFEINPDTDYSLESSWCKKCEAYIGDDHDCDNCSFCGTDSPEEHNINCATNSDDYKTKGVK